MPLLLHICCAPCSVMCIETLRAEGIEPTGFWYNPNIHGKYEYKTRRNTLTEYARSIGLELLMEDEYGLRSFIADLCPDFDNRCEYCYTRRLTETADYAAAHGFDSFSTTLLISPYQNHALIREIGERLAAERGLDFLYRDFRPFFREGQDKAEALGLYRQKYCGCIFSEEDRYTKHRKPSGAEAAAAANDASSAERES